LSRAESERQSAQAVVIGSGAGGAPAAALLAEAGLDVVLLEAGPRVGAASFTDHEAEMTARLGRMATTADGNQSLYAGACLGGSTTVNDAICWRTPPEVLEAWEREHALSELAPERFAPHVERAWRDVHAEPTPPGLRSRNAALLERGATRLGWAGGWLARSVRGCAGLGRCNLGCPLDAKQSTLVSYLPRAERAGARVLTDARVVRLRVEAGAAAGVEAVRLDPATRRPRGALRVDAPIVCLAAGVLGSGVLLQRSGLGPAAGRGLQLHSSLHVTARFAEPVHGSFGPTMAYAVSEFSDVDGRAGPGFMLEDTAVTPLVTASALPDFGEPHARAMEALPFLARAAVVLRDRARGRARAAAEGSARIDYRLLPEDLARLRDGVAALARAYLAAGALEVFAPVDGLGPLRSEADLARFGELPLDPTRLCFLYAVHLFGGAAMGGRRAASFCQPDGRSWEVRGLYLTDAAALPGNTGVNPQITILANSLRVAEGIAAGAGRA
jgi:choline dehydrogenase-like flavoprotein